MASPSPPLPGRRPARASPSAPRRAHGWATPTPSSTRAHPGGGRGARTGVASAGSPWCPYGPVGTGLRERRAQQGSGVLRSRDVMVPPRPNRSARPEVARVAGGRAPAERPVVAAVGCGARAPGAAPEQGREPEPGSLSPSPARRESHFAAASQTMLLTSAFYLAIGEGRGVGLKRVERIGESLVSGSCLAR